MPKLRTILKRPTDLAPATAELLASLMSTLPLSLRPLSPADATLLHTCYAHLACKGPPSVRLHCVRSFPAMLTAPDATGHPQLTPGPLLESYSRFVTDVDVRFWSTSFELASWHNLLKTCSKSTDCHYHILVEGCALVPVPTPNCRYPEVIALPPAGSERSFLRRRLEAPVMLLHMLT